jgi:hypothetical protein
MFFVVNITNIYWTRYATQFAAVPSDGWAWNVDVC